MVTAEKIIEYVLYTPHNSNRMVLKSLLEDYLEDNGGGSLDNSVIVLPSTEGTTVTSPIKPNTGDKVTITPNPLPGKRVVGIMVITVNGEKIEVIDNQNGTYSYIQPKKTVIPIVDYDSESINPDDVIIYDGGRP